MVKFGLRLLLCTVVTCAAVWAQATTTSNINGTVQDASGLAVPGAEVKITQTDTGLVRIVTSGADGGYLLTTLPVGPYQLTVTKEGFSTFVQNGIVLQVNSNPTINVSLKVGQVTEQVQVEASAAIVETQNTAVGQVVDNQRVLELPLNGRNAQELILNSGPAVLLPSPTSLRIYPGLQISVAGGSLLGTLYVVDGADHNNVDSNSPLPLPFPDALQEFKVETSSLPARYGHHAAAAINVVTKSGGNEMHGDLFEFLRNGAVNARNTFAARTDTLKRNQFGGVVGGAIIKNKLFYFGGYQQTILRTDPGTSSTVIPTADMRAGDFRTFAAARSAGGCQTTAITLGAPFVGNQISPAQMSPITTTITKSFPSPQDQKCGQVTFSFPARTDEKQYLARVDFQKSDKHSLFARYFQGHYVQALAVPDITVNLLGGQLNGQDSAADTGVLGDTYLISPTTILTSRASAQYIPNTRTTPNYKYPKQLGINVNNLIDLPFVGIAINGGWSFGNAGQVQTINPGSNVQLTQDIDMTRGSHQLAFGYSWSHTQYNNTSTRLDNGEFIFGATRTGLGYADFAAGLASQFQQGYAAKSYQRGNLIGVYTQDAWKVSRRLMVNLGVRWEPFLPSESDPNYIWVEQFSWSRFMNNTKSTVFPNAPAGLYFRGDQGWKYDKAVTTRNWKQFSPRAGLVFDPQGNGKQVIRLGYGIYTDVPTFSFQVNSANNAPFGSATTVANPRDIADPWADYPGGSPFPYTLNPNLKFPLPGYYNFFAEDLPTVYIQSWNASYQRQFGADWAWTVTYLGNKTTHQWLENEMNPATYIPGNNCVINGTFYATCSTVANTIQRRKSSLLNFAQGQYYDGMQTTFPQGNGHYEGLTTNVNKRLSRHVSMQVNFTWSHCISLAEQGTINNHYDSQDPNNFSTSRGDCNQDVRKNFNSSFVFSSPKIGNALVQKIVGNWQLSPIIRAASGFPINVLSGKDNYLDGLVTNTGGGVIQRPNIVCDPHLDGSQQTWNQWFTQSCYKANTAGVYGNSGRNSIRGPKSVTVNVALTRTFAITERHRIEVRGEAFNIVNTANYLASGINSTLTSSVFGKLTTADDPRILQFALKYVF